MLTNVEKTDYSQFSSITQSCPTLCNPMNCSTPDFPITNSQGLLKLMSIKLVMPSKHLMLYHPLLLLPSVFPSIRVFPVSQLFSSGGQSIGVSDSASVFPMNIKDWFLRIDWFYLLEVQGTLESLLQHHSEKASILLCSAFCIVKLSHPYMTTGKTIAFTRWSFASNVMFLLFILFYF